MKFLNFSSLVAVFLILISMQNSAFSAPAPVAVGSLDLTRYVGDWYQISHVPLNSEFNQQTCACSRQRLGISDGAVNVRNTCNASTPSGPLIDINGYANYTDAAVSPAQFTVTLQIAPNVTAVGPYWVIGIDQDYRYAVVSNDTGTSLYILSRTPVMDADLYNEAVAIAIQQKIDLRNLQPTVHKGCSYP
jgi:apolipoprotein D and lipocalin family protein